MTVCAFALLGAIAVYVFALWQPERQLRLHQRNLLRAVEKRNWDRFASFIAPDYSDRWQHDREFVVRESREVFRQFLFLTVRHEVHDAYAHGGIGNLSVSIKLNGSGGPLAEFVSERVNHLGAPFTFRWRHRGWKPWEWELVEVNHPDLELPE
jgi:predicted TIM-barrel fold metal-dependent hydrolase